MGKVWESGVVQVVQNAENLSVETHPCNRLQGGLAGCIGEIVYVPVYDRCPGSPAQGVVAVLELMMNSRSTDVMVVANIISSVSEIMGELTLALHNPTPPSAKPVDASATAAEMQRRSAPPTLGMHPASYDANNAAWGGHTSRGYGSGGGLARAPSVRTLQSMQH